MSGIANLNMVVQQGNSAQEMQPARHLNPEQNQMVASQQQGEKALREHTTVQASGDMEKNTLNGDGAAKGRYLLRQKKKRKISDAEQELRPTGRLLDTVA
ncbi:MAG: hypothetical protein RBT11_06605 [Desulfobacterales bacterium]|jgi:hypothetical protein|nr:hypothetical protein [Desulfobacterales bacterium]